MVAIRPVLMIIDDDPLITGILHFVLSEDFEVLVAASYAQLKSLLKQLDEPPTLALVDLGLPPTPHSPDVGFKIISELLTLSPTIKIHVLSGQSEQENTKQAMALGAINFFAKPCDVDVIKEMLLASLKVQNVNLPNIQLQSIGLKAEQKQGWLLGDTFPMQALRLQISQLADSFFPVLIEGESGSGKELVASGLHKASKRILHPYLSVNCAAISPLLAESILFGHAKGAFTGAIAAHVGYFEKAAEGTLFLDEIGELPLELQAKLLRVLENGEYQRIGETQTRKSLARIVAATNRDLRAEVRAGKFRADLYHRLSVLTVKAPPLRDLGEDKHLLRIYFTDLYSKQISQAPFTLDDKAHLLWLEYDFPGNVRELRNVVIRLIAKYAGKTLSEHALVNEFDLTELMPSELPFNFNAESDRLSQAQHHFRQQSSVSLDVVLKDWEQAYIKTAIGITNGNLSQAAKLLNVNRTTLYNRMNVQ